MGEPVLYDGFPLWVVAVVVALSASVYAAGAYVMFTLDVVAGVLYLIYLVVLEVQVYREGCVNCFYYGKVCAFGRGVAAAVFFKRGDPKRFCERELSFKDLIPQALVVLVPMVVGAALLISRGLDHLVLAATSYPLLSWFLLNPVIYGRLACPHCRQGSICCPALKFFTKKTSKSK